MRVFVDDVRPLRFDDGTPVTAASGIAPLGDGWLIAQDDATFAAWRRADGGHAAAGAAARGRPRPVLRGGGDQAPQAGPRGGLPGEVDGEPAVLLLGSGSTARRMRGVLVRLADGQPVVHAADLDPLYDRVARRLGLPLEHLNLEGASRHGATVRWFNRGNLGGGRAVRQRRRPAGGAGRRRYSGGPTPPPCRSGSRAATTWARSTASAWR